MKACGRRNHEPNDGSLKAATATTPVNQPGSAIDSNLVKAHTAIELAVMTFDCDHHPSGLCRDLIMDLKRIARMMNLEPKNEIDMCQSFQTSTSISHLLPSGNVLIDEGEFEKERFSAISDCEV